MKHLESALQQYRLLHTPTQLSVYQFWANQKFSNNDLFFCSPDEKEMFYNRLEESNITFCKSVKDKQGQVGNLKHLIDIITNEKYKNIKRDNHYFDKLTWDQYKKNREEYGFCNTWTLWTNEAEGSI